MRLLLLSFTLTIALGISAFPNLTNNKKYHIVCQSFPSGCVTDGTTAGQRTPLYHLQTVSSGEETFWLFTEVEDGIYTIKNSKTGQYVTYDGIRQDSPKLLRYINMTSQENGNLSRWRLVLQSEGVYAIRNVQQTDHIWDVRVDSYCVGTYSSTETANQNQCFKIYDEQGNQVTEKAVTPVTTEGYDVSSWLTATTESTDGWTFDGDTWSDPGFGNYLSHEASVISPFLERWNDTTWGALADGGMSQTLTNLPAGKYTLTADIIATRQASNGWSSIAEETGHGVYLFAGSQQTEAGTHDQQPQHYSVSFTVGTDGTAMVGLRLRNTNANWVAIDNLGLYFQGTEAQLVAKEKEKVMAELLEHYTQTEAEALIAACGDDFEALETLRRSVALLPKANPLSKGAKNICIDGSVLAYSQSLDLCLATTSEEHFGTDYTAAITYERREGWSDLMINGTTVAPGATYRFAQMSAGKTYTFSVKTTDGTATLRQTVTFTALPVVKLYGTFSNDYSEGSIQVIEPGMSAAAELLNMKAKWRGGITNSNGKNKRNYHVKLKDAEGNKLERKFFGLRNDNSWILESCQVDMSRIRNRVLTDLWNDYSTPPYYINKEKKAMTGTRGRFVELILNDEYRGIYCMTENMDRKQMKLKKYDETTATTHGQLWKSKDWSYATLMGTRPDGGYQPKDHLTDPMSYSEMWDSYQVKYPDFEDNGYQTDWQVLYNAVNFVCRGGDHDFYEYIQEYFDIPLVIDYYILMESILATDNHGKNMFFAVYDKQEDKRITFGVWDMDATCGQRWSDQYYHDYMMQPEQDYAQYISIHEHGDYNLFRRLRELNPGNFNMKVRLRYRDLRQNYLKTDNILQRFKNYLDLFKLCGADKREYAKWSGDTDIDRKTLDFDNEMYYLTDWFTRRMNYLDNTRFNIKELPDVGITPVVPTEQEAGRGVYTLDGRRIGSDSSQKALKQLPAGLYIVNGRKVVVGR